MAKNRAEVQEVLRRNERYRTIAQQRKDGKSLAEIGANFRITRERVRQILNKHSPDSLYPDLPNNLYTTGQLLKLSGRKSHEALTKILKGEKINPEKRYSGLPFWGENAYQFIQDLLNRRCLNCGKPSVKLSNPRYKFCSEKCRREYYRRTKWRKGGMKNSDPFFITFKDLIIDTRA